MKKGEQASLKDLKNKPIITYLFLGLSIGVYLLMLLFFGSSMDTTALLTFGAKFNYLIIFDNQWWRLITAAFVHIGFTHLLLNGISIYFMGSELELLLGKVKFAAIYLLAALGGNLFSYAFNPLSLSAGASTAIFGLFASFIALSYIFPQSQALKARATNFLVLILINFVNGIMSSGTDNWGHLGGAIFGFLTTLWLCSPKGQAYQKHRQVGLALLVVLGISLLFFGYQNFISLY